jgi:oligoendopeptidase F
MPVATLPKRSEIPVEHTWNLESMYSDNSLWEKDYEWVGEHLPGLEAYKGRLAESAKMLHGVLKMQDNVGMKLENVVVYAYMRQDEDTTNSFYQAYQDKGFSLYARFNSTVSFVKPEIIALPEEKLHQFYQDEPGLEVYRHYIQELRREREHVRSAEIEELLAASGEMAQGPDSIYSMLTNADMKFGTVTDENGDEIELTKGRFVELLESPDRNVRKAAFETFYDKLGSFSNTIAASYASAVKGNVFYARARKYNSALEASLSPNNIPVEVYDNLVTTVNANLDKMHRYMALRKKLLGVNDLQMYDIYTPLIPSAKRKIGYQEACETVLKAFAPLGDDYVAEVEKGIKSRWIDVHENVGKTSGAYSSGSYQSQPFILMNYQDNLDNMYTLAHELGHSLHTLYSNRNQPFVYAGYTLFVAEVASTTNEGLLTHYLLQQPMDKETRLYLINNELEKYRGTLFRQTLFAEFERETHARVESGEALTAEWMDELYLNLNKRYYGDVMNYDARISKEWMRIPHFYRAFYVYQYSTGISAATALANAMIKEGAPAVARYREFLRSGSSNYSIDLLAKAGVDMLSPQPVQQAIDIFDYYLTEMERLTAE